MPHFKSVGFIDDAVFTTHEAVMKEYHRRYSLMAYHERRDALVRRISPEGHCAECARILPPALRRASATLTLCWRDEKAEAAAKEIGIKRANALITIGKVVLDAVLKQKLVEVLCEEHAKQKLWGKGSYTHGTYWGAYRHKCQCDECLEYRADHILRRREDRRAKKLQEEAAESAVA